MLAVIVLLVVVSVLALGVVLPRLRERSRVPTAFLSYRRDISAMTVAWLNEALAKRGIEAFYDIEMSGTPGHFPSRLTDEIEKRDVFVCVLGDSTLDSEWVINEIRQAHQHRKPMIPVFLESYRTPPSQTEEAIKSLLESQGEQLLDQRGIHLDYSLNNITSLIKGARA